MPPVLKVFTDSRLFVPYSWLDAMGAPHHHPQCHAIAVAANKADLALLLAELGISGNIDRMAANLRLARHLSYSDEALISSGVVDVRTRSLYAYRDAVKDQAVIRIGAHNSCSVVGHFRIIPPGHRLTAEKEVRDAAREQLCRVLPD